MDFKIMIGCALVLFLIFTLYRGDRLLKVRNALHKRMEDIYGPMSEIVENVIYQGGFPPMPKPARLSLGLTGSELVLFDKEGNNGRIEYGKIKKVDSFTTKRERKRRFGVIAYGPLAFVLNKPAFRHFFVAEYTDVDDEDNIVMFLVGSKAIADRLQASVKPYIGGRRKKR
ncbi:MAG: hypothetical protein LBD95_03225 [Clostridiales Family XIII bacterium]|jgi:hypothetical protein|nr:hypothetical protein [Clostridiales Family XIII bacterium]